jgi:hypothetical protein
MPPTESGSKTRRDGWYFRLGGRARVPDIVEASVVEGALRRGDLIVSSDEGDLAAIAAAVSRHIGIDHP